MKFNLQNIVTRNEQEIFDRFFREAFELDQETIQQLWINAASQLRQIQPHLDAVRNDLENRPMAKLQFLKFLNHCIISDGFNEGEYETFEQVEKVLLANP